MIYKFIMHKIYWVLLIVVLTIIFRKILLAKELLSGYHFSEPSTQAIQDDDFTNPGFIWIEHGKILWDKKEKKSQLSCNSCHGTIETMKGVSLNFPKVNVNKKFINLEQQINICRKNKMKQKQFPDESKNLLALSALLSFQSKGLEQNIEINKINKKWFELGKKLYFENIGQMGLSCSQCHDQRVGKNLRAEKVSQGHINGFPTYLLRWSKVASVHKRIQFCNEQAKALPFKIFSNEYNALQLYMTWRGNGLKIETPAVRK